MSRFPLNYAKIENLRFLSQEDLLLIHTKAKSLSAEEVCDYLGLDLDILSDHERKVFNYVYRRGRADGIASAAENLFMHMKTKAGGASCLAYLQQMSSNFKSVSVSPNSSMPSGFSFQVVMGEDQKQEATDSDSPVH